MTGGDLPATATATATPPNGQLRPLSGPGHNEPFSRKIANYWERAATSGQREIDVNASSDFSHFGGSCGK